MNKIKLLLYTMGISLAGLLSCEKEFKKIPTENTNFDGKANVRLANFVVNSNRNYVFVDNIRVSGTSSAYTSTYPTAPSFMTLDAGTRAIVIRDTLPTTTQVPINLNANLESGSNYTIFTYDSITNAKSKLVKDEIVIPTDTTARIRFAHFAYSTAAVPNVDLYSTRRRQNIYSNISLTTVTDFIPYASGTLDTLYVRETGKTANLGTINGFSAITKRSYTVIFRGSYRLTTGTASRTLSSFLTY
jgi:Domain of unknown function (DUF4397)